MNEWQAEFTEENKSAPLDALYGLIKNDLTKNLEDAEYRMAIG